MRTIAKLTLSAGLLAAGSFFTSCEKDEHVPPAMEFRTGTGYTSSDVTVGLQDSLMVGVIADKTEDELKLFNVSVMYDAATTSNTLWTDTLSEAEEEHYEADLNIMTRNVAGEEHYTFTITDMDGNITSKHLDVTVQ